MVAVVVAGAAVVLTLKVAVVEPAATVTLAGTVAAAALLLDRVTSVPPLGAAFVNVTVAVEGLPPVTVAGFNVSPDAAAEVEMSAPSTRPLRSLPPSLRSSLWLSP